MAEAQQARVQTAVENMVEGLEREHIRKMQVSAVVQGQTVYLFTDLYSFFCIKMSTLNIVLIMTSQRCIDLTGGWFIVRMMP